MLMEWQAGAAVHTYHAAQFSADVAAAAEEFVGRCHEADFGAIYSTTMPWGAEITWRVANIERGGSCGVATEAADSSGGSVTPAPEGAALFQLIFGPRA